MLSIIIPTLNEERFMQPLLKSLVPQLEKGDEIIIVDSHSNDRTVAIARKYRCRVVSMPRKGIAAAKNKGARKAKNSIVAFLDADCVVSKRWLEKIKKHFKTGKFKAVAGLDLYRAHSKKRQSMYNTYSKSLYHAARTFHRLGGKAWLPANNCAIEKRLFLKIGG